MTVRDGSRRGARRGRGSANRRRRCPAHLVVPANDDVIEPTPLEPGLDLGARQVERDRGDQLVEHDELNLVEGKAAHGREVLAIGKPARAMAVRPRLIEQLDRAPDHRGRNRRQRTQRPVRQLGGQRLAQRIDVLGDPLVVLQAVDPVHDATTVPDHRSNLGGAHRRLRQVVDHAKRERQIEDRLHRRTGQIPHHDVGVRQVPRVLERDHGAFAQVHRHDRLGAEARHQVGVPPLAAAPFEDDLAHEVLSGDGCDPPEKLALVVVPQIRPPRPLLGEAGRRLGLDGRGVTSNQDGDAPANREAARVAGARELALHDVLVLFPGGLVQQQGRAAVGTGEIRQGFTSHGPASYRKSAALV